MVKRKVLKRFGSRLGRALYLLGRPARGDRGQGGILIQPYRGFASGTEIFLMGRVFRQQRITPMIRKGRLGRDLVDIARRISRHGAPDTPLTARFCDSQQHVTTDRDGYFQVELPLWKPPSPERLWHRLSLEAAVDNGDPHRSTGIFFFPPKEARYVVISDIDDTVIFTGVANKVKMVWRLFFQGVRERVAFPGVAAFYRALHSGAGGSEFNPMLYVSRSPWGLYEILEEFFDLHDIPVGPILFLREWGISWRRPFPRRAKEYKFSIIRRMLSVYNDLPFILIGDSGQRDPEIYAQVVREHPGRILAIYIRDVTKAGRRRAIDALASEVAANGTTLLLAADTHAMAKHAAEHGFIPPEAISAVMGEKAQEQTRVCLREAGWPWGTEAPEHP
jgi:phosphatidate phosphatase APP1